MLFNSLQFAVFFALVYGVYRLLPHRGQNRWLLLVSYLFYAAWDWRFLGLILLSTVVDFLVARALEESHDPRRRRWLVTISIVVNLGILGVFKYADFFSEGLARMLTWVGFGFEPWLLQVALPVGISFYTFQTLGYTIDVYRRQLPAARDPLDFALFVSFFPQLVAGPIERAKTLLPQVMTPRQVTSAEFRLGSWLLLWGLFKKVVIGDNLAPLANAVYNTAADPTGIEVMVGTVAFALQIYCDFSGYSDMARGLAKLLGFELMVNFRLPYLATSPADFWRRWHISLSTWLRDYLYISLGGNREGRWRTYRNLLLTMVLGGLWHGAAWNFVAWGVYHGLLLAVHRALRQSLARLAGAMPAVVWQDALWRVGSVAGMWVLTCVGWLLFRVETLPQAIDFLGRAASAIWLGTASLGMAGQWLPTLLVLASPLLVMQAFQAWTGDLDVICRAPMLLRALVYALLISAIVLIGQDFGQPFIYFQF